MSNEVPALRVVPSSAEEVIRRLRRCPVRCPMIETLDQRMAQQQKMVEGILKSRGLTVELLSKLTREEMEGLDEVLQLCWHILRDVAYIDNLR